MKTYKIYLTAPVLIEEEVQAKTLKEAQEKAREFVGCSYGMNESPLPQDEYYITNAEVITDE
jgi:hypothetical protein|tara:strand:+ start:2679 stop:2864 length:186 start_codon:yes stop_codon:yes gene_type:complete